MSEADSLGALGEYEIGLIFLEEILENLNEENREYENIKVENQNSFNVSQQAPSDYSMSLVTGIDYDLHEFEFTYIENDSTIIEQLNNPYIGFNSDFNLLNYDNLNIDVFNSLRYDKENLRDNYSIIFSSGMYQIKYGGYFNKSYNTIYSSYWENNLQFLINTKINKEWNLYVRDNYNYKVFDKSEFNYTDYYRNYFETNLEYKIKGVAFFLYYTNTLSEFLGNANNDYLQNTIDLGYRDYDTKNLIQSIVLSFERRSYSIFYNDSTINNKYFQSGLNLNFNFRLINTVYLKLENNIIYKNYLQQSIFEPSYLWNYFRSGINHILFSDIDLQIGFEWELKLHSHISQDGLESTEQNYNSDGIFSSINYFSQKGINFSLDASYQWRRYPKTPTNQLINLYSSRNIFSLMALGNIPLSNYFELNVFAIYDNDKDLDSDQGQTQSSIYNIELRYNF